jgi:hypothetical protein
MNINTQVYDVSCNNTYKDTFRKIHAKDSSYEKLKNATSMYLIRFHTFKIRGHAVS